MKRITKTAIGVTLSLGLIFSGVNFVPNSQETATATDSKEIYKKNTRELVFYGEKEKGEKALSAVMNSTDEALLATRKGLNKEKVKIKFKQINEAQNIVIGEKVKAISLPYNVVLSNEKVKTEAKEALNNGIKIYLYDENGITLYDYKEVLEIEKFSATSKESDGASYDMYLTDGEVDEKEQAETSNEVYQVIGYTSDSEENTQFNVLGYTTGEDDKAAPIGLTEIVNGVIGQEVASFNANNGLNKWAEENEVAEELKGNNLLETDKAEASSTFITSKATGCKYIKPTNMMTFGKICTDHRLYQDFNEISKTYDRFTVKEYTQTWKYNNAQITKVYTNHDIPYSTDEIEESAPASTSNRFTISASVPWGISVSMDNGDAIDVSRSRSIDYDYSRWTVTDGYGSYMENGVEFNPGTAWLSTGSFASMDIDNKAYFYEGYAGYRASGGLHIDVNYDYATANTDTDTQYP